MSDEIPKKIPDAEKLDPTQSVQPGEPKNEAEEGKFASYMQDQGRVATPPSQPSPMEVGQPNPTAPSAPPSPESIQNQINSASSSLGDIKNQLNTKNLKLKQSHKHLLRNKLQNANENIRGATEKLGADPGPNVNLRAKKNPIAKFLTLVSDGQQQLNNAAEMVKKLDTSGQAVNPGQLLLVQVKLQKAQQELDYTSVLLGKAVDVIKTLFNVQI